VIAIVCMSTGLSLQATPQTLDRRPAHDQDVVAVVLDDLATYRGKDSPIDEIFSPNPLTLDPTPLRYALTVKDLLQPYEPGRVEVRK
jgi:hypothetical protein